MTSDNNLKGLVLCGGRSSRMQHDKSSIAYHNGVPQWQYLANLLLAFVPAAMMALRSFRHPGHGAMTVLLVMSRWEWLFALLASSLALASTSAGLHRHGRGRPLRLACVGAILLLSASLYLPLKESLLWHGVTTACGGMMLAAAHIGNRRALRNR